MGGLVGQAALWLRILHAAGACICYSVIFILQNNISMYEMDCRRVKNALASGSTWLPVVDTLC